MNNVTLQKSFRIQIKLKAVVGIADAVAFILIFLVF